jgi:hypothetical protein
MAKRTVRIRNKAGVIDAPMAATLRVVDAQLQTIMSIFRSQYVDPIDAEQYITSTLSRFYAERKMLDNVDQVKSKEV